VKNWLNDWLSSQAFNLTGQQFELLDAGSLELNNTVEKLLLLMDC